MDGVLRTLLGGHFGCCSWCGCRVDVDSKGGVVRGDLRFGWCKWLIDAEEKTGDLGCSGGFLVIDCLDCLVVGCCLT